jgi:surfeit locus 1 family protein
LARFKKLVPYAVQPVVIQLDTASPAGFARDWPRPDERWEKHLSYALQWYGFAASAGLIWFFLSWRKS